MVEKLQNARFLKNCVFEFKILKTNIFWNFFYEHKNTIISKKTL